MLIYGYTRISSKSAYNGKKSNTVLFSAKKQRNKIMYEDYSDTFDVMAEQYNFKENEKQQPKKTEEEFMTELSESDDMEHNVFGLIEALDCYGYKVASTQFEPFCKVV